MVELFGFKKRRKKREKREKCVFTFLEFRERKGEVFKLESWVWVCF